jgi:hypothetical protein
MQGAMNPMALLPAMRGGGAMRGGAAGTPQGLGQVLAPFMAQGPQGIQNIARMLGLGGPAAGPQFANLGGVMNVPTVNGAIQARHCRT